MELKWFSGPYITLDEAKESLAPFQFFQMHGVFQTPEGEFVTSNLRLTQWTDDEVKAIHDGVLERTGYRLIAWTTALFGWKDY